MWNLGSKSPRNGVRLKTAAPGVDILAMRLAYVGVVLGLSVPLVVGPPAVAAELPTTPTLTSISVSSAPVQGGEEAEVAWTGDTGGVELFYVKAFYRDFDWGTHELMDGAGDTPTTGVMRATVDDSWASGPAVPTSFAIFDIGGSGRIYYFDDPRTSSDEGRSDVYYDGDYVGTEYDIPDLFGTSAELIIREALVDTAPPRFTALSISQSAVSPGGEVLLSWSGSDDHTGIRGIRVQVRDSDGMVSEILEEYDAGPPPTFGTIRLPVPDRAPDGIYEVTRVSVFDNACNERFYLFKPPNAQPASAAADCASGTFDLLAIPDEPSIAPLAVGVGMTRPEMEVPAAPTNVTVASSSNHWVVRWQSAQPWSDLDRLQFYDWLYQVELDGEVVAYPWPELEAVLDEVSHGEHIVRVRAVNRFGPGAWSEELVFSTSGPGPVLALTATGRLWGAGLSWRPPTVDESAESYVVVRRTGILTANQMPQPTRDDAEVTAQSFADSTVESGQSYTYAVYGVDAQGQSSEQVAIAHLVGTHTRVRGVVLEPGDEVALRGRVTDLDRGGVPGVRVVVQRASVTSPADFTAVGLRATTKSDGTYRLTLTPRRGWIYRVASTRNDGYGASWSEALTPTR